MFCPNCGNKTEDIAVFCGECGTRIVAQGESINNARRSNSRRNIDVGQQLKSIKLTTKIIIVEIVLCCIVFNMLQGIVEEGLNETSIVKRYINHISNGEYEKAAECFGEYDSPFITEDKLIEAIKNRHGHVDWSDVNELSLAIRDVDLGMDEELKDGEHFVGISYVDEDGCEDTMPSISISKSETKRLFFWDDYRIDPKYIADRDYEIYVVKGAEVFIDGIKLDESYLKKNDTEAEDDYEDEYYYDDEYDYENLDCYIIPIILEAEYELEVKLGDMGYKKLTMDVSDSYRSRFIIDELDISEEIERELANKAVEDFKTVYDAAINEKEYSQISNLFKEEKMGEYYTLEEDYIELCEEFVAPDNTEEEGVVSIDFYDMSAEVETSFEEGGIYATVELNLYADVTYDEDRAWVGVIIERDETTTSDTVNMKYIYMDGEWFLVNDNVLDMIYFYH